MKAYILSTCICRDTRTIDMFPQTDMNFGMLPNTTLARSSIQMAVLIAIDSSQNMLSV